MNEVYCIADLCVIQPEYSSVLKKNHRVINNLTMAFYNELNNCLRSFLNNEIIKYYKNIDILSIHIFCLFTKIIYQESNTNKIIRYRSVQSANEFRTKFRRNGVSKTAIFRIVYSQVFAVYKKDTNTKKNSSTFKINHERNIYKNGPYKTYYEFETFYVKMNLTEEEKKYVEDEKKCPFYRFEDDISEYTGGVFYCYPPFHCLLSSFEDEHDCETHMNKWYWINKYPLFTKHKPEKKAYILSQKDFFLV